MKQLSCPHCKAHRLVTSEVPENVVVVLPCPSCREYSVLFRDRLMPLDRDLLENGSQGDRVAHIAKIIAEILDEVMGSVFRPDPEAQDSPPGFPSFLLPEHAEPEALVEEEVLPITDEEFSKFVRVDLKCLDNANYFKRHFLRD